ncbi:hypothetical protein FNU76_06305 [Chitinimonas arctica]|uniref:Uncharacterized protein n=1 Tax=Chitinimonas arctica TaxID=2594795 RepID=A0A516SCX6_9NEIS|nr:hypothetical protein [Chitinimonas arctica]QDQ25994.1 hypothetical protein FNU76_06305 [Chitinimonas arctica]
MKILALRSYSLSFSFNFVPRALLLALSLMYRYENAPLKYYLQGLGLINPMPRMRVARKNTALSSRQAMPWNFSKREFSYSPGEANAKREAEWAKP